MCLYKYGYLPAQICIDRQVGPCWAELGPSWHEVQTSWAKAGP